ncbi:hypothetical protein ETAA8_29890 [Anatilimnocola aggregata]|uniref:Sulfatase n=1 Tax=Anatilimnocola aggregata TaxID=2528021 RepID=A0A517YCE2_9BACT|nr:DUF1501 domain-containing protein [Anatilimnocola aggregata]QDU27898.1 hypothetical protein ETAA8_29890 [Anatilimnocola aggregata]
MQQQLAHLKLTDRRSFFQRGGLSLGALALCNLLQAAPESAAGKQPHFAPRAKRVIYLHMIGAPSQLDLFDAKPELVRRNGEACPESLLAGKRFAFLGAEKKLSGSKFKFAPHGESGQQMSELLPNLAKMADEIAVVRSLHTEEINHAPAQIFLHTGFGRGDRPSFGSWVTYGLGSINADLPAYVVLLSGNAGGAGTAMWSSGFLPSVNQGVQFRSQGDAVLFLSNPQGHSNDSRRRVLDATRALNEARLADVGDPEIATRISQYEMAFRMQTKVPELIDIGAESQETLERYGAQPGKASFANNCLLARRLVERGVRVVELYDADWDHHSNIASSLPRKARDVDQPMAALLADLKERGLLNDTLVVWGSEFGRTPLAQGLGGDGEKTKPGRDHHKDAFTMWLAGGGIKPGCSVGATDEFGFNIAERPVHVHDLNATILHLLGLDHERLTFQYQGREFRLTDVHGHVVRELLA